MNVFLYFFFLLDVIPGSFHFSSGKSGILLDGFYWVLSATAVNLFFILHWFFWVVFSTAGMNAHFVPECLSFSCVFP